MDTERNLSQLPPGTLAAICGLTASGDMRRHLMDLGFTPGAGVCPLYSAPSGSPTAYRIRGSTIALRRSDAACVLVTLLPEQRTVGCVKWV